MSARDDKPESPRVACHVTFVGTLLRLAKVSGRLQKIENLLRKSGIGQGPSWKDKDMSVTLKTESTLETQN